MREGAGYMSLFALVFFLGTATESAAQSGGVVNTNGSFENAEPGVVSGTDVEGWNFELGGSADAVFEIVTDNPQDGDHALKVAVNERGASAWNVQAVNEGIPVEPGKTYELSVWFRSDNPYGSVDITVGNAAFQEYGRLSVREMSSEWQEYKIEFRINDQETSIRAPIHFSLLDNDDGGVVYMDNLRIVDPTYVPLANVNGSFEDAEPGVVTGTDVDGWSFEIGGSADAVFEIVTDDPQDGDQALKITVNERGASAWHVQAVNEGITVVPGDSYRLTAWFRSDNPYGSVDITVGNAAFQEYGRLSVTEMSPEWQEYTVEFRVTDEETVIRAPFHFSLLDNDDGGVVYMDNVRVINLADLPGDDIPDPTGPPLADGRSKWLGSAHSISQEPFFLQYWNQVTSENDAKWGHVEGTRGTYNWTNLDRAYNLAKDNDLPYRFHVLVWGNQQPTWMAGLVDEPEEQLEAIEAWFRAVAERYPDLDYVEVVNEPLHDPPGCHVPGNQGANCAPSGDYYEALGGAGESGWDWVLNAFRMARDIFPETTKLMINEYGILSSDTNVGRYLEIIELLQAENLIDVIGVQGHAFSTRGTAASMITRLDQLGATGLPIQVTEMDVDGNPNQTDLTVEQSDATQLSAMQRIFPALWTHPSVEGITMWGWRPGMWRTPQEAYLVRTNGQERPALEWMREYIASVTTSVEGQEVAATFVLFGNYPNPFNPTTQITYQLSATSDVRLDVYDILGRHVRTLASGLQPAGHHSVTFDASNLSSGVYLYRLQAGGASATKRMLLIK
jgi:endo-1,4-beta-xylanase